MRHRSCGNVALLIAAEVVDNPDRPIMVNDVQMPSGEPLKPKVGKPLLCPECGAELQLGPRCLEVDRGPDAKTSSIQRAALKLAQKVVG